MSDEQFPGNPKHAKLSKMVAAPEEEKRVEGPVVTGEVVMRKKGVVRKIKDIFFGGDFKNAGRYVLAEVALPALRNMVVDTTSKGIERVIFGPDRAAQRSRSTNYGPRVQYNNPIGSRYQSAMLPHQPPYLSRNARMDVGDIILPSREDCEVVLEKLGDIVDKFRTASKSDLMELLGQPSAYTDQKWGWSFLGSAEISQIREGWILDLPPMEPI